MTKTPGEGPVARADLDARIRCEGFSPRWWSNDPGDRYGRHAHAYRKVLFCAEGSIVFHTRDGDIELLAGDRLDVAPETQHAATVGPDGVTCVEGGG
ncbi:MAG TPA: AraC family ligand binding domain-containing protein [Actinomycetota bacterium]